MKKILGVVIGLLITHFTYSQPGTWVRSLALTQYNYPASVWELNGNKYMVCGTCGSDLQKSSHCFMVVDSLGHIIQSDLFGGQDYIEYNKSTYLDKSDSSYLVIGLTDKGLQFDYDLQVTKYSKQMQRLWSIQLGHSAWDSGLFIEGVGDGYILAGYLGDTLTNNTNAYLAKIDLTGNLIWERELDWGKNEEWKCVKKLSDGSLMAIGKKEYQNGRYAELLGKFTLTGDTLWTDTFMIKSNTFGTYLEEISDNQLLVTANAEIPTDTGIKYYSLIQKFDMNGNMIWHWEYDNFTANMVKEMADGYLISVGGNLSNLDFFEFESLTFRMYSNGWFSNTGTVGKEGWQEAIYMQTIKNGNGLIVLANNTRENPELHNMLLYKTDSIGAFIELNDSAFISIGKDPDLADKYEIFPNPSQGKILIRSTSNANTSYTLIDQLGKIFFQGNFDKKEIIDLENLENGIYSIQLQTEGKSFSRRIVKTD
ncbi:MAG: T9SS type A sorting domain-containing protein [Bacteroidia bacterium]|nr:T9SS type A sorting domain-containing protein [Bacteroidia bacterium]